MIIVVISYTSVLLGSICFTIMIIIIYYRIVLLFVRRLKRRTVQSDVTPAKYQTPTHTHTHTTRSIVLRRNNRNNQPYHLVVFLVRTHTSQRTIFTASVERKTCVGGCRRRTARARLDEYKTNVWRRARGRAVTTSRTVRRIRRNGYTVLGKRRSDGRPMYYV